MKPIWIEDFFYDGRGPELRRIHWDLDGRAIRALDYVNPTGPHEAASPRRVVVLRPQVVMITPEEVIGYEHVGGDALVRHRPAAMFDLGVSDWMKSFSPLHLERCHHFRLFFYDELVDLIAEGVNCERIPLEGAG